MPEFKHMRIEGFFKPHGGEIISLGEIDPKSFKLTSRYDYLDPVSGDVVATQRTEMTFKGGKTAIHDVLADGTRVRWTDTEDLVHAQLDALADAHGYDMPGWTADELAIDLVMSAPALDGRDPLALEPACAAWLQNRRKG
jgi:hypothetical protein